jgi:RNA polymerase subunit RPABC4/transcription elongation factor Spt4
VSDSGRRGEPPEQSLVECPHCGALVPDGAYCGDCGAHLVDPDGRLRADHYAAAPNERVVKIALVSTFFPHLPQRHAHVFREALIIGVLVVVLLGAVQLYAPALLAAAVLLPVLYVLYLHEVGLYESEPVRVFGATFVVGAALGTAYTLVAAHLISGRIGGTRQGPIITAVLLPVIAQLLMLIGPLLLLARARFDETLDGLTFGVLAALGFTTAAVITGYWHVLTAPLRGAGSVSATDIAGVLRSAILAAIVNAGTTATVTASVWLQHHGLSRRRHLSVWRGVPVTVALAFGVQIALGLASYYARSLTLLLVLWAVADAVVLVWLRILIHNALLEEGSERATGAPSACPECHRLVPTMLFCPACGVARSAASKRTRDQGLLEAHG